MNLSSTFRAMLTMLASFFSAGEKIGKTFDNLATVAFETSGAYVDEARADREEKKAARDLAAAQATAAIAAAQTSAATPAPAKAVKIPA